MIIDIAIILLIPIIVNKILNKEQPVLHTSGATSTKQGDLGNILNMKWEYEGVDG